MQISSRCILNFQFANSYDSSMFILEFHKIFLHILIKFSFLERKYANAHFQSNFRKAILHWYICVKVEKHVFLLAPLNQSSADILVYSRWVSYYSGFVQMNSGQLQTNPVLSEYIGSRILNTIWFYLRFRITSII